MNIFDYPSYPQPKQAPEELRLLLSKVREHVKKENVVIITAKEGGGTRSFIPGVDDVIG
jgi:hypothetical protein